MCLTLSLPAFPGRGDHFETFACTKKTPSRLFPFSYFLEQRSRSHVLAVMGFLGGD